MLKTYLQYIKDNPNNYWFKAKWFGWGWTPVTRQGWIITAFYIALVIVLSSRIDENAAFGEIFLPFVLPVLVATAVFIYIAYKRGEKPRWQWFPPKAKKDQHPTDTP